MKRKLNGQLQYFDKYLGKGHTGGMGACGRDI